VTAAQVRAEVLENRPAGGYRHLVLRAPEVARDARPGHFVACAVGGAESALLLRRAFSLHRADAGTGTVEVVVAGHGPGTRVIAGLRPGETLDVVGPLGQPFELPDEPVATVLVGGGYGSAPLSWLAESLRENGSRVDVVIGAADAGRLFGEEGARGVADSVTVTTVDGSAGTAGLVTDVMPALMAEHGTAVVYACGPMGMLRAVHEVAERAGATSQLAVEESMACGIGVCMTCVLPVRWPDGSTRMTRACVEGPVFAGDRLRWEAISSGGSAVPDDALGAPVAVPAPADAADPVATAPGAPA
jgi:dihydroorotate dehydrogenase electron transfer subunit